MSVIVTKIEDEFIYVGSDTLMVTSDDVRITSLDAKLFHEGNIVAGLVGDLQQGALFRMLLRDAAPEGNDHEAILGFYSAFRTIAQEVGTSLVDDNGFTYTRFLMVVDKRVWRIDGYSVIEINDFDTMGSGGGPAYGVLYSKGNIVDALAASCQYTTSCDWPLVVYKIPRYEGQITRTIHSQEVKVNSFTWGLTNSS